jgi:oligoribonuclease (3'-5' exoribonuclease)
LYQSTLHSVLKKKTTKLNSQPAQYEKNKINKDDFEKKIIKRKKKTMYGNTVAIHNVFFLNYMDKFSTSSIFRKIGKDNFEKK